MQEGPQTAAWQLVGSGLATIVFVTPSLVAAFGTSDRKFEIAQGDRVRLVLRFGLSAVGYVAIIVAGFLLLASQIDAFVVVM